MKQCSIMKPLVCVLVLTQSYLQANAQPVAPAPPAPGQPLSADWRESLFLDTGATVYRGKELKTIGMPVGGIGAGQLYLRGDGSLAEWWIANNAYNTAVFSPLQTPLGLLNTGYFTYRPTSFIDQGFRIVVHGKNGDLKKDLNQSGFDDIRFTGEYPIARVDYKDSRQTLPVDVSMEVFSPFIPLDARESATPGTYFVFTVKNSSAQKLQVDLGGWLQNPVCLELQGLAAAESHNKAVRNGPLSSLYMDVQPEKSVPQEAFRETVFEDFEKGSYEGWELTGAAFGERPATGRLGNQQEISGFTGGYFINSYTDGDRPKGRMLSHAFTIRDNFVNFLIGGGNHPGQEAFNLLVDGKVVMTATGRNAEHLELKSWDLSAWKGKQARFEIVDDLTGDWGHITLDRISFSNRSAQPAVDLVHHPYYGNCALSVFDSHAKIITDREQGSTGEARCKLGKKLVGELMTPLTLAPGEERRVVFVLSWYFPRRPLHYNGFGWGRAIPTDGPAIGNMYANWFGSSLEVASWLRVNQSRLSSLTHLFHDSYYRHSSLPYWLNQRLMMPVSTLATETCQWWSTGKFWAWEGVGSCDGTCTHVWNYEQALAHLFPELERNIRERTDFGTSFRPDGGVMTRNGEDGVKTDGHVGTILKAYREHLNSANDLFLSRNWEKIKKATEYIIRLDSADGTVDGILREAQPNTYDVPFYGPNTFVGSLYLASLKAAGKMALLMKDSALASRCRRIEEAGSRYTSDSLWNGHYFVQRVDLTRHPKNQYALGCLSDQLFGQTWAHLLHLGYLYPKTEVKETMESVWKYNWKPDVGPYNALHPAGRIFAFPGDPGLLICSWPFSRHMGDSAVPYRDEVWTGVEYQVATHMIYEGMLEEGLSVVRGIHERYSPEKHNPWNEVECGDHYARALASWGVLIALEDYFYDGPAGELSFAPKLGPDNFSGFFTTAKGWGNLVQRRNGVQQMSGLDLKYGELDLERLVVTLPAARDPKRVKLLLDGKELSCSWEREGNRLRISVREKLHMGAGELRAEIGL